MMDATSPQPMHLEPVPPEGAGNKRIVLILASLFLLGMLGIFMFTVRSKSPSKPISNNTNREPTITPSLIPHPTLGSMTVYYEGEERKFSVKNPVKLLVKASSQNKDIVGYDVIFTYDKEAFSFVKAVSKLKSFNLYTYNRSSHISFSGIKSLQNNTQSSWVHQPLMEITLNPKRTGKFVFQLSPNGKEASKLVDVNAQVVYPKTNQLQLEIYE